MWKWQQTKKQDDMKKCILGGVANCTVRKTVYYV